MTPDSPKPDDLQKRRDPETDASQLNDSNPWPALLQIAELVNELATRVEDHEERLGPGPPVIVDTNLEEWVIWLSAEYGLHSVLGDRDRWASTPPVRNELVALRLACDVLASAKPGSFEPVYWHDALTRVIDRIPSHYSRWATNRSSLEAATRANGRASKMTSR